MIFKIFHRFDFVASVALSVLHKLPRIENHVYPALGVLLSSQLSKMFQGKEGVYV